MSAHRRIDHTWYDIRSDHVEKGGAEHERRSTPGRRTPSVRKPLLKMSNQMLRLQWRFERQQPMKQPKSPNRRLVVPAVAVETPSRPRTVRRRTNDIRTAKNVGGTDTARRQRRRLPGSPKRLNDARMQQVRCVCNVTICPCPRGQRGRQLRLPQLSVSHRTGRRSCVTGYFVTPTTASARDRWLTCGTATTNR